MNQAIWPFSPSPFPCTLDIDRQFTKLTQGLVAFWRRDASLCAPKVGAECGAGVAGIVSALGEIAASGSLAMTSCKEFPLAGEGAEGDRRLRWLRET